MIDAPQPDVDALSVALALVPGLYSRNRYYELFEDSRFRRARARAALLRGVVRELGGKNGPVQSLTTVRRGDGGTELTFRIAPIVYTRRVVLSALEASCLAYLAKRAGVGHLVPVDGDRAAVEAAVRRLAGALAV